MCVDSVEVGTEHAEIEQNWLVEIDGLNYCVTQLLKSGNKSLVHWLPSKGNFNHFVGKLFVNSELRKVSRHQTLLIPYEQVLLVAPSCLHFLFKL